MNSVIPELIRNSENRLAEGIKWDQIGTSAAMVGNNR